MLKLRKVTGHLQAPNAYRVVLTLADGADLEVGSIGHQTGNHMRQYWYWGLDTVLPSQAFPTRGEAIDRDEAMVAFKAMWEMFTADSDRLAVFLADKLRRSRA